MKGHALDSTDLLHNAAPITQANADMDNPRQHAAWALVAFPSPNKEMGDVPISPPVPVDLSERLWDFGFRHHPDLQTQWYIPGDHPEGGFLNVPKVVGREEYEQYRAEHADPDGEVDKWTDTARSLLGELDPKLLARIDAMTDEQKAAAAEVHRKNLPPAFQRLAELHEDAEKPDGGES